MPEVGSASLAIIPSFKGFQSNLESGTGKAMTAAGVTGGTAFGDSAGRSAGTKFRAHVRSFAKVAAVGLGLATAGAIKFAGDSIAEAREAQKVGALTASTIKATGGAARVTAKHVGDLAGKISAKTGIDDEAIQAGQNMLLTFKNIRNEAGENNKIFDESSRVLTDFSAAMGTDAKSSAIQLGKALNDPVKGVTALGRAGVQFSEDQKAAIKKMVESGNILGAQKVVLRELKSEFGGAAAAQATEADKLSVAWGNFKEEIGTELLPVMDDLARFLRKKGIPAARDFAGWVRDDMIPAAKDAYEEMKPLIGGVKDLAKFINDLPKPAKIAGIAAILGGITYGKLRGGNSMGGGGALGTLGRVAGLAKPIPVFVTNPGFGSGLPGTGPGSKVPPVAPVGRGGFKGVLDLLKGKPAGIAAKGLPATLVGGLMTGITMSDRKLPPMMTDAEVERWKRANGEIAAFNDAASKLPNQLDQGKTAAERLVSQVYNLKSGMDKIPSSKATRFEAPNLLALLDATYRYKGMLDGLDGRTVTTFLKSVRLNNDTGESGDPRFGGFRAHGGSMHPGYSYVVGERGPELVTVGARSEVAPNGGTAAGFPSTVILNVDGDQFRAYVDNRINAAGRHPTGRRR